MYCFLIHVLPWSKFNLFVSIEGYYVSALVAAKQPEKNYSFWLDLFTLEVPMQIFATKFHYIFRIIGS